MDFSYFKISEAQEKKIEKSSVSNKFSNLNLKDGKY